MVAGNVLAENREMIRANRSRGGKHNKQGTVARGIIQTKLENALRARALIAEPQRT